MLPRGLSMCYVAVAIGAFQLSAAPLDCEALAKQAMPAAAIHATIVDGATFTPPGAKPIANLPIFCRVEMTLTPSADSQIQIELWLPAKGWNGKLQGIGNGGYAGSINYDGLAEALRLNYATVATDTGHHAGGEDASWALNHSEKITDFGYRAIHLMTADAREVVQNFYGEPVKHAYFNACSDGGREALMEAQRFPTDYDGIIAGAPAYYWTHLLTNAISNLQALLATSGSFIPPAKLPAIQAAAQRACDLNDGVKDNVIENPAKCRFDTSLLLCKGADSDTCLTSDQLTALNQLYNGGHTSGGKRFFPGYPPGGEASKGNWDLWVTGPEPGHSFMYAYGTQFFKNMVYDNPNWDFRASDLDHDLQAADQKLAGTLNAANPDISDFVSRGGKLILYHGWDDGAIAAPSSIEYFKSVNKTIGAGQVAKSVRLFMVPGMNHCFNGNGAYSFGQFGAGAGDPVHDIDAALVQWVEHGDAPSKIIASNPVSGMTHPLCAYPKTALYDGKSDPASAASYTCAATSSKK